MCVCVCVCVCDGLILGVPLTTRQLVETYGYRVSRYHTHLSHILRPIPAYLIHKYTQIYDRLFNLQSIYSHFIQQKGIYELNKAVSGSHPICGLATCTGPVPERGILQRCEQSPVVIIFYKGYSPPKYSCNGRTNKHTSK